MDMISFAAGILKINWATVGWTIWAIPGDQQTQHVVNTPGGSVDVSYPQMGMDSDLVVRVPTWSDKYSNLRVSMLIQLQAASLYIPYVPKD